MSDRQTQVEALIARQLAGWEMLRENYAALDKVRSKTLRFDGFSMDLQFNPERIRSTTAPVDEPGTARPCFLCAANRFVQQESIGWNDYELLINPYPIFPQHLTIPHRTHTPQRLTGRLDDLVRLSEDLPGFVITFNGARSGASIPGHMHFQAVGKGSLPAEKEIPDWTKQTVLHRSDSLQIRGLDHYLRPAIAIEGRDPVITARAAATVFSALTEIAGTGEEAEVNALAWTDTGKHRVVFFPRTALRPREFYAGEPERILFSPGVMDLAGTPVTVRENDFTRIDAPLMRELLAQVVPDAPLWEHIKKHLSELIIK